MESLFDLLQRSFEVRLVGGLPCPAGLCREKQRLPMAIELLCLLFVQAGMRHGGGDIIAKPQNDLAPLLAVSRRDDEEKSRSEQNDPKAPPQRHGYFCLSIFRE